MRFARARRLSFAGIVLLGAVSYPAGSAQFTQNPNGSPKSPGMPSSGDSPLGQPSTDPDKVRQQEIMERSVNDARHKRLVMDTERLVLLTAELKADVDKATKNQLSLDVIKKAAEIERLARDVKERMKQ